MLIMSHCKHVLLEHHARIQMTSVQQKVLQQAFQLLFGETSWVFGKAEDNGAVDTVTCVSSSIVAPQTNLNDDSADHAAEMTRILEEDGLLHHCKRKMF